MKYDQKHKEIHKLFTKVGLFHFDFNYDGLIEVFSVIVYELKKIEVNQDKVREKQLRIDRCLLQLKEFRRLAINVKEQDLLSETSSILLEETTNTYLWLSKI
jgi:hypothetical protein